VPLVFELIANPVEVLTGRTYTVIEHVEYSPDFTNITLIFGVVVIFL
jgi:hypothetical protein